MSWLAINLVNLSNICSILSLFALVQENKLGLTIADISLRGKLIVYDNEKLKIGWTQTDCAKAKPRRFKSLPYFEG